MKSAWFGLSLCLLLSLQGCSKPDQSGTVNTTGTQPGSTAPGAPPQPESKKLFEQSKVVLQEAEEARKTSNAALEKQKVQQCFDTLGKAVEAAKAEKNPAAAVLCSETQARLRMVQKDYAGAAGVLESILRTFDIPNQDINVLIRLDEPRAMLAMAYAMGNLPDKADTLYKQCLDRARQDKPLNHQRVAFWMKNYSDYYKFEKKDSQSQAMAKAAKDELDKDPGYKQAPGGGAAPPPGR